jgi:hypothetical protein
VQTGLAVDSVAVIGRCSQALLSMSLGEKAMLDIPAEFA